jgi:hypothetical protein
MTLRRTLAVIAVLGLVWAGVVALGDGFVLRLGSLRISSRDPWRPLITAAALGLAAFLFTPRDRIRAEFDWLWTWIPAAARLLGRLRERRVAARVALAIALAGVAIDVFQWSAAPTLWLDEEMIALNVRDRSFAGLSGELWLEQSAPYGWLVLQRAVLLTLGDGERALRFVPLVFGIATVLGALAVGRRWLGAAGMPGLVVLCWISQWLSHYRFEVKHYSADVCFGLVVPALAVWAIEGESARARLQRATIWWSVAAIAQFLANGALLVTPGCAVLLLGALWRRDGWRAGGMAAAGGLIWAVALAGHYELSLRFTGHLRDYWADRFPPHSIGAAGLAPWFAARLEPLADNPAGTSRWLSLWLLAAAGFAFDRSRVAAAFALVPVLACVYAIAGLVPPYERFSIWMVPALYVGVCLLADRATEAIGAAWTARRWIQVAVAIAALVLAFRLAADIVRRGYANLDIPAPVDSHDLNDRSAVHWLSAQWQPGDILVTTRLGWPAIWWYGHISIARPEPSVIRSEGYVMTYEPAGPRCRTPLERPPGARRLLVYLGFPDVPDGFEPLLDESLGQIGGVTTRYQQFSGRGRVFVVDLATAATADAAHSAHYDVAKLPGCVGLKPLRTW